MIQSELISNNKKTFGNEMFVTNIDDLRILNKDLLN